MKKRFLTYLITGMISLVAVSAAAEPGAVGFGPINITGETPLQTMRLNIVPNRFQVLAPGKSELQFFNTWTNRWNVSSAYIVDLEMIQNVFHYNIGIGGGMELGLSVPIISRTGGILDPLIEEFHREFGISLDGRDKYPQNKINVSFINDSGERIVLLNNHDVGTSIGDISLHAVSTVYQGGGVLRSIIFSSLVKFPTSSQRLYYGSGGIDGAFSLSGANYLKPIYLYTTIGYGMFGSGSRFGVDLRPYQWTFFAAVEWPLKDDFSLIAQQLSNSAVATGPDEFASPTHELTIGAKQKLFDNVTLEYGVVENLFIFSNSIDFGFVFGLSYSL